MVYNYTELEEWGALGIESSPGTLIAPSIYLLMESLEPKTDITDYIPPERRGKRAKNYTSVRTGTDTKIQLKMDAFPEAGLEHLWYLALGGKTSAIQGAGPAYKHTMTQAANLPVASIYKNWESADSGLLPEAYAQCMLDSLSLSVKENDACKVTADFISQPIDIGQTDKTQTYPVVKPFVFPHMTFKWSDYGTGVASETRCTSFDMELKNGVKTKFTANNNLYPSVFKATDFEVTGKLGIMFEDRTLQKSFLGGTGSQTTVQKTAILKNVEIEMIGELIASTYYYTQTIKLPRVLISDLSTGDDPVEYQYSITAMEDSVTNKTIDAAVTSKLVSIV
jgi:hypothetical protein